MSAPSERRSGWFGQRVPRAGHGAEERARLKSDLGRLAQVLLGLFSVGFAVYVLSTPNLSVTGLLILLGEAMGLISAQTLLSGGRLVAEKIPGLRGPARAWRTVQSWSVLAIGLVVFGLAVFAVLEPGLAVTVSVFVLALALVVQGFGQVLQAGGVAIPTWRRGSLLATGVITVALVVGSIAFQGFALPGFAILVGLILFLSGIETVVAGLHPTDPRQWVLLKLILFSAFYGLILINWIDLFGKQVPAYGLWLILTYMAPFGVLMVFEGWRAWPLAVSLGLLVSLFNDVGYFFIGNLLFGFHENLGPWIAGQLGFRGTELVTIFEGGRFTIDVTSWMMGVSIYARAIVVGLILYYWWRHPGGIVARTDTTLPVASAPGPGTAPTASESPPTSAAGSPGER